MRLRDHLRRALVGLLVAGLFLVPLATEVTAKPQEFRGRQVIVAGIAPEHVGGFRFEKGWAQILSSGDGQAQLTYVRSGGSTQVTITWKERATSQALSTSRVRDMSPGTLAERTAWCHPTQRVVVRNVPRGSVPGTDALRTMSRRIGEYIARRAIPWPDIFLDLGPLPREVAGYGFVVARFSNQETYLGERIDVEYARIEDAADPRRRRPVHLHVYFAPLGAGRKGRAKDWEPGKNSGLSSLRDTEWHISPTHFAKIRMSGSRGGFKDQAHVDSARKVAAQVLRRFERVASPREGIPRVPRRVEHVDLPPEDHEDETRPPEPEQHGPPDTPPPPEEKIELEIRGVRILDANPLYTGGRPVLELDSPQALHGYVTQTRQFVAADGVTQVVLEVETTAPGVVRVVNRKGAGRTEPLFGGRAIKVGVDESERYVAYGLYTAPDALGEDRSGKRNVDLPILAGPSLAELGETPASARIRIVRPPVLLVHGTFDKPDECWESDMSADDPAAGTISMATALRNIGYRVFKVDYEETNGSVGVLSETDSSFKSNERVLWNNDQGLFEALSIFRDEYDVAVTQADVVGHSMGGLIPRLWASDGYNPPGAAELTFDPERTTGYRRPDNFGQGDIHRLITIGTTHMGSDLGHLGIALLDRPNVLSEMFRERSWRTALEYLGVMAAAGTTGYGISPAVRDQRPFLEAMPNHALAKIGPTRVPSHAIVCTSAIPDLEKSALYKWSLRAFAYWMLNWRPEIVKSFFEQRGQASDLDRIFDDVTDLDQRRRAADDEPGSWLFEDEAEEEEDEERQFAIGDDFVVYALARAVLFGNTQNDMVVRVESQTGGLPLQCTTRVRRVLHSHEPRYASVQDAVVTALTGGDWRFAPEGFPEPEAMRNIAPFDTQQDPRERARMIGESNIVASHAESLSYVAHSENIIIIMRPVNEHATSLIQLNQATKDMHVKGKSANWGPQRGYIPVEQRFSKLHFADASNRAEDIRKYDGKVRDCLAEGRARGMALRVTAGETTCDVLTIDDEGLEPPRAIVLRTPDGTFRGWQQDGSLVFDPSAALPPPPIAQAEIERLGTHPFQVLADRHTGRALTADYDILAFGPRFEPGAVSLHPEMGYVTEWQKALIRRMNNEVRLRGNYDGGNVSHHGPETQFEFSEGADYPNAAFEPDGDILIIPKGPPGQQDRFLKRYFHRKRAQGFNLAPNPHTWNWGAHDPERWPVTGWRPEDRLMISATVLAEDNPYDSDEGDELVPTANGGR